MEAAEPIGSVLRTDRAPAPSRRPPSRGKLRVAALALLGATVPVAASAQTGGSPESEPSRLRFQRPFLHWNDADYVLGVERWWAWLTATYGEWTATWNPALVKAVEHRTVRAQGWRFRLGIRVSP